MRLATPLRVAHSVHPIAGNTLHHANILLWLSVTIL